jgi:predicted DNA-binding transcriptional regulator YafY
VNVLLQTTMEEARRWIAPEVAVLEAENDGVVLRCCTDDLPWMARLLASVGCPLTVRRPSELIAAIKAHAVMLLGMTLEEKSSPHREFTSEDPHSRS